MAASTYKKGDKVTTVHGEKLTILDVQPRIVKKNGVPTGKTLTYVLAESGGSNCWFPETVLKVKRGGDK